MNYQFFLILIFSMCFTQAVAENETTKSVRLPSITHTWKTDGSEALQETTLAEIDKCIGKDMKIRDKYQLFKDESDQLENEANAFEPATKSLTSQSEALDRQVKTINEKTTLLNSRSAALEKENHEISDLRTKKMTAETAKKLNAKIDLYNAEVKSLNTDSSVLRAEAAQFEIARDRFNAELAPLKLKLEAFNNKAAAFRSKREEFNNLVLGYKDKCEGSRSLVK